jgi:hypothetical protein
VFETEIVIPLESVVGQDDRIFLCSLTEEQINSEPNSPSEPP